MQRQQAHEQIAILDFGSQYTHLIARRLRDISVLAKIYQPTVSAAKLKKENVIGIILSGGPQSVYNKSAIAYNKKLFDLTVPMLGLCYGHQLIAHHFGGHVKPGLVKEYGFALLKLKTQNSKPKTTTQNHQTNKLFQSLSRNLQVWMSHGDSVQKLPLGFETIGKTANCPVAAMANEKKRVYGLQFHPEVTHTQDENKILYNFAIAICGAKQDWKIKNLLKDLTKEIQAQTRDKKVFMLVSGGVDSTVAFALLEKTLGKSRVIGLHINSGVMRKNESQEVKRALSRAGFPNLSVVNASDYFLKTLRGVTDPEEKRHRIGEAYLDVAEKWFEKHVAHFDARVCLGQGTIYPDTIESQGTTHADKIKTHHNRIPRIQKMIAENRIIEPLKNFYKDEVRVIGKELGISPAILNRHPFPGPGLAIMTLCSKNSTTLPRLSLPKNSFLLPVKSTGVQGDVRSYAHVVALQTKKSWDELEQISTTITNRYRAINRVVKTVWTRKPLSKIGFTQTKNLFLTKDRLDLLREIHARINRIVIRDGLYEKIWEFPIVLIPVGTSPHGQSIVLRPIHSTEAMTVNFYRLPQKTLREIVKAITLFKEIDAIFYDLTHKPPATVQWE